MVTVSGTDITIARCDRASIRFHFTANSPVDNTPVVFKVAKIYDQSTAVISVTNQTVVSGYVTIPLTGGASGNTDIEPGTYVYWLRANYPNGSPAGYDTPICGGKFEVLGAI